MKVSLPDAIEKIGDIGAVDRGGGRYYSFSQVIAEAVASEP
jgi:hypothetical protein